MGMIISPPGVFIDGFSDVISRLRKQYDDIRDSSLLIGIEGNLLGDIYYYVHKLRHDIEGMSLHGASGLGMGYGLTRNCMIFNRLIKSSIGEINVRGSLIDDGNERLDYYLDAISGFRVDARAALTAKLLIKVMYDNTNKNNSKNKLIIRLDGFSSKVGSVKFVKELGVVDVLVQDMRSGMRRDIDSRLLSKIEESFSWLDADMLGMGFAKERTVSYKARIVLKSRYDIGIEYN